MESTSKSSESEGGARILVVDDDPGVLRLLERALQREGHTTFGAKNGQEALALFSRDHVDLMLVDLNLPDLMGQQVVQELAKSGKPVHFIVVTGRGDERVAVEMMKSGAMDYVVKDSQFLELVPATVARALNQIRQARKLAAAEQNLRSEHRFISAVLETAGALVVVVDPRGCIERFNHACERVTGYSAAEVAGRSMFDLLIPAQERKSVEQSLGRLLTGQQRVDHENHWVARDGSRHLIQWSNTILTGEDGSVEHIVKTGIDVTRRAELERQIAQVEDEVRQRIGHDLHDDLCQRLAGIEIMSQVLQQKLAGKSKAEAAAAGEVSDLIRQAIGHTKDLARGLAPVVLESEGLMSALTELAESTQKRFGIACVFVCDKPVPVQDHNVATQLYRIAQEAVSNATRHADASQIEINLAQSAERLTLCVKDNGKGLAASKSRARGMGLHIMQHRAKAIAGTLSIDRAEDGGTAVLCSIYSPAAKEKAGRKS